MAHQIGFVRRVGQGVLGGISGLGGFTSFTLSAIGRCLFDVAGWWRWRLLAPQLASVGVASIPVVALTGAFIGMVLALESYDSFARIGQEGRLGAVINLSVTKQIGPVLAAVMVAGRVGGALTAELGTMRVTEQIDALRVMATNPLTHLVVPRVVACIVMTPIVTIYSDILGVWGGWIVTVPFQGVSPYEYWDFTAKFIHWWEPTTGLIKSVFFGAFIGIISCYKGFTCRPGAAGVGRATTEAFVSSFLTIIALNLILAQFLNTIGAYIVPE